MIIISILLLLIVAVFSDTQFSFTNYCQHPINTSQTVAYNNSPMIIPLCELPSGYTCNKNFSTISWILFQQGFNPDDTYTDFRINVDGMDQYFLDTDHGFKYAMQIQSNQPDIPIFTCRDPNCDDSYDNNNSKIGNVKTGGKFDVIWCPYNDKSFFNDDKKLPSVEPFKNNDLIKLTKLT